MAPIVLRAAKARKSSRDYPGAMLLTVAIADIDKLAPGQGYSRLGPQRESLRANNDETLTAAIITEQGGKENHRERDQDCGSFCSQFT